MPEFGVPFLVNRTHMIDYITLAGYRRVTPVGKLTNELICNVALQLELVATSLIAADQSAIWSRVTIA